MEKSTRQLFNPDILTQILDLYGIQPDDTQILDGFESFIYNVRRDGKEYILRIGHDGRRSPDMVWGEAEFLNHLASGGLSVPSVLSSLEDHLIETVQAADGSHFVAILFTKAPGHPPSGDEWQPPLFKKMGIFLGKLHRLSKIFIPSNPCFRRFDIEDDFEEMLATARRHLPASDMPIIEAYQENLNAIRELPKTQAGYGLCHVDFHGGNFFLTDDGKITLFDFDDCQYAWFVYDIAMALFYTLPHDCREPEQLNVAQTFLQEFWNGYRIETDLDKSWLGKIPLFLRLREIDLYIVIYRSMDLNNLDPWCASFMDHRREKILTKAPYCKIDYSKIRS
jgi:Ser/Thr protein kinase RdoA (MazF antagonist)